MTDHPTRRKMLATIATAAAVAPLAALPALAQGSDEDAGLLAFEPRLLAAQAAVLVALDVQGDADERYFAERPPEPVLDVDFGKTVDGDRVIWAKHSADLAAWQKADAVARLAADVDAAGQASSAAHDAFSAIAEAALATRTRTIAGIAFKLRLCNACGGDTVAEALLDDLEAMGLSIKLFDEVDDDA
jgi:hypothetical protein